MPTLAPGGRSTTILDASFAVEGKTWNNLALAGEYLLVRNGEEAACYRLPLVGP